MKRSLLLITIASLGIVLAAPSGAADEEPFAAIEKQQAQIDVIAAEEGEFSLELVDPLIELSRIHSRAGDATAAEDTLRHAQHIIHRNEGVHALRQLEIVELMTELDLARDEPYDAERQQELAMYLAERNYGKDSSDILPRWNDSNNGTRIQASSTMPATPRSNDRHHYSKWRQSRSQDDRTADRACPNSSPSEDLLQLQAARGSTQDH
ncbi:MAG: hypothetical protein U5O39_07665 [Gammaproteobacteria bacterium]|nr:hypothetical protein [Gammaproteobacteria bacterium]